ncbi:basic blue protein-like isoform X1 [Cucurbita pepo subsp. pepo]|uniref:basic blue protein-like isoform X1 n=1 Tax=Cucurbita pepo subsp. pepo TaxID=3664 RepID=UPI000C9D93B6|nr:basic blue protein-like isoform X1 [Cucurbita pepo subsp. pepo]
MARQEGSSRAISMSTVAVAMALLLLLGFEHGDAAATFVVGDSNGWNLGVEGWPNGKVFRAGDILRFNYNPIIHNVVAVDEGGYRSCIAPRGAKVFNSGKDEIKLSTGHNFFICTTVGHCQFGMKIAINSL